MISLLMFFLFNNYIFPSQTEKERHYLQYMYTALTKADSFPQFCAVAESDDLQISHYSNEKQAWVKGKQTDVWNAAPGPPPENKTWYLDMLYRLANCTKSVCSELHVLQREVGCELKKNPDETKSLTIFDKLAFNGKYTHPYDFNLGWIDQSPFAKVKWSLPTEHIKLVNGTLTSCLDWISTFNNTKKIEPVVYMFARKAPDDDTKLNLICLATGFYPRDIEMNIRLNKSVVNDVLDDQTSTGVRPNGDGSFQMRISVMIDRNSEGLYYSYVNHSSLREPISLKWDGTCFDCETSGLPWLFKAAVVFMCVVIFVFLLAIGYWIYRKNRTNGLLTSFRFYGGVNAMVQVADPASANVSEEDLIADGSPDES